MADLKDQLSQILNNPDAMKQVQSLSEQLGLSTMSAPAPTPPPLPVEAVPDDLMKNITKILPLLSSAQSEDNTTRLLKSLRPFLSVEKKEKLDKAEKMLKLIKIIPILKNTGIF